MRLKISLPLMLAFLCLMTTASPSWATPRQGNQPGNDQTGEIEAKLEKHAQDGSEIERRLKATRAKQKAKLLVTRKSDKRNEVIIIGSSSIRGALGRRLASGLERDGFKATRWGRSASGLSRLDYYDWFDAVTDLPIGDKTAGVIVYVGVNDPQGIWLYPHERKKRDKWIRWHQPGWDDVYRERVVMLIDALCAMGVPKVAVLTPVDVRWPSLQKRLIRVRRLQIEGARLSKCGAAVSGSGDILHILDDVERHEPRRARDGYHLTWLGGDIVWQRIKYRIVRMFRGQPWVDVSAKSALNPLGARSSAAHNKRRPPARTAFVSGR